MPDKKPEKFIKAQGTIVQDIFTYLRLIIRLMGDPRVNILLKCIPVASVLFVISPLDFPGPIDDAAILGLGIYTFIELCPKEVVDEHMRDLNQTISGQWKNAAAGEKSDSKDEVIDGEFQDKNTKE